MITGMVTHNEGRIRLILRGRGGRDQEIEAVLDTGFTAALTLPRDVIATLNLRWQTIERFTLADGTEAVFDVYEAKIIWDGRVRSIVVLEADAKPLIGMKLLKGHELKMQVCYRGRVAIKRLTRKYN
jgi:clan AA aspartic protease